MSSTSDLRWRLPDGREGAHRLRPGAAVRIGRDPTNDLALDDPTLSRHHAIVLAAGGQWLVQDLGSTSGLYLDGARTEQAILGPGGVLRIGGATFTLEATAADAPAEAVGRAADPDEALAPTPTRVDRVTVHPNGALVVRVGEAAPGRVRVDGLPLLHDADSLRVRPAAGGVRDLRERCALEGASAAPRAPDAVAVAALQAELAQVDAQLGQVDAQISLWREFTPAQPPEGADLPDPTALLAVDAHSAQRVEALAAKRATLRTARRDADARLQVALQAPPDPAPPRFTRGLAFTLDAEAPTAIEIEYFVPAARWVPTYRIDLEDGRAHLRTDALVAQATGEAWGEAAVSLATADLHRETTLPELMAWRIGTAQPPRRPAFRPPPEGLGGLFNGYDGARQLPPPKPRPPARPPAPPPEPEPMVGRAREEADAGFEDDLDDEIMAAPDFAVANEMAPPPMAAPAPMPSMAPQMARAKKARSAAVSFGGAPGMGGGGAPPAESATIRPPNAAQTKLRHAYLRLAGPDEPGRGELHPVDPLDHLWSLLGDRPVVGFEALRRALDALRAEAARMARSPLPPGTRPPGGESWHYVHGANGLHSVPADGRWHRVAVRADRAPANLAWRAVPRGGCDDVHRVCRVETPAGVPFPTGPLQVYIDGRYRVSATLDGAAGGPALVLDLGVDPAVRIVERTARIEQSDKGLMTTTTHVDHEVITRVRSAHTAPVTLELYDRLPVLADEDDKDLSVTALTGDPAPERTDRDPDGGRLDGGVRWTLTIPPHEVRTVTWRYRLEFPAKYEVVGGNRRE